MLRFLADSKEDSVDNAYDLIVLATLLVFLNYAFSPTSWSCLMLNLGAIITATVSLGNAI